jgi:hypothetical protein
VKAYPRACGWTPASFRHLSPVPKKSPVTLATGAGGGGKRADEGIEGSGWRTVEAFNECLDDSHPQGCSGKFAMGADPNPR